ncbi:MAG: outer membrane protein assembly factor BamA [Bryobacteraceae bacterium]
MKHFVRWRLAVAALSLGGLIAPAGAQQAQAPPAQQTLPQQKPPQPAPQQHNPFEEVPGTATKPAPPPQPTPLENVPGAPPSQPAPQLEAPKPPPGAPPVSGEVIKAIEFRGARRVPSDTLKALIYTKMGDLYNEEALRRDFMALWNTGRFDDIVLETEPDPTGGLILRFVVTERRVIRTINYEGIHTVTVSEILDRFKERKVGLVVESQYDPNKIQHAAQVLKDFLAERGRQYATVDPVVEQIPPSSLKVTFDVKEGPKVKVGKIIITGNKAESQRWVIAAMKNLHPYGIPHSILFESLFAKTYDQGKLDEDKDRVRQAYQDHGYFLFKALDETVKIYPSGGHGWRLPIVKMETPGIYADITIPVEEGRLYRLDAVNFVGVKLFREPSVLMSLFGMKQGDVFSTDKLRKGLDNMRKLYGQFGYINFVPEPAFDPQPDSDKIDLTITADEGKQFFIRRIDFAGNTTTRDRVIRREILLDEGDMFNTQLWDLSILRLNQLGYFEMLKKEEAADIKTNPGTDTVDITLKVKEKGKNTIGLNGGVSGIAGSFLGANYSTNNFLGLGETLSLNGQLGTRMQSATFGFTEPYLFDKPIQAGFSVFVSRFDYNQAREASILYGQDLLPLFNSIEGPNNQNLLNYIQNSKGFNVSLSYQLHRSFWRAGITYGYSISDIVTQTTGAQNYFDYINFSGVYGPNALNGIDTSAITPSISYNTVNNPINPTGGKSIFFSVAASGSVLGGNVNTLRPAIDLKYFKPSPIFSKKNVLAFHFSTWLISGYGGKLVPPFSRSFMGGEQDIRGFDIWGITPIAFVPSSASVNVLNSDGSARTQNVVVGGVLTPEPVTMTIPTYQIITPGGDWQSYGNFEYRIPIVGQAVSLVPFFDAGVNRILRPSQLTMDPQRVLDLNEQFPSAGYNGQVLIAPGTEKMRASTGLEIDVILPVVNAPFRVYFAYNPLRLDTNIQTPIAADRSMFPNQATFNNAIANYGPLYPWDEKSTMLRFTVGRTF